MMTPLKFQNQNPVFEYELKEDSMTDKERIALEELQVQTADMYISDNLIGEPITDSTNSLSTTVSNKTIPEEDRLADTSESEVARDVAEVEMVTVEVENEKTDHSETAQISDDDGIRVTGIDNGEFVLLNANDHVVVPGDSRNSY